MLIRRHLVAPLAALAAVACSKTPTTPTGTRAEIDLRSHLPAGVTAPPDAQLTSYEATRSVCGVDDSHPGAEVKLTWKAFTKGADAYLASVIVEVTKPAEALTLSFPTDVSVGSANLGKNDPYNGIANLSIGCKREMFRFAQVGGDSVAFDAAGKVHEPTATSVATSKR